MTRLLTILAFSAVLLSSCNKDTVKGEGAINTETRTTPAFNNVEMGGSGDVTISYGTTQQVTVNGYQNLLNIYETKVQGSTLYLQFRSDIYNVRNNNIKVNITVPALSYMRINGSGKINAADFVNGDILTASINGSGNIFIGNSNYNKATYSINGSGDIKAASTTTAEALAQISGSGNIDLHVNSKLNATISGSGSINYWGNPANVETQVSGSGKITKK